MQLPRIGATRDVGKLEGKTPLARRRCKREDNIKTVLTEFEDICCIHLTKNESSGGLL
jgi:hypothetical protein